MIRWYYRNVRINEPELNHPYVVEVRRDDGRWLYIGGAWDMRPAVALFISAVQGGNR